MKRKRERKNTFSMELLLVRDVIEPCEPSPLWLKNSFFQGRAADTPTRLPAGRRLRCDATVDVRTLMLYGMVFYSIGMKMSAAIPYPFLWANGYRIVFFIFIPFFGINFSFFHSHGNSLLRSLSRSINVFFTTWAITSDGVYLNNVAP